MVNAQIKTNVRIDEMEGTKVIKTEPVSFKNNGANVDFSLSYAQELFAISVNVYEGAYANGCFSPYEGIMKIKLMDGTVLDFKQFSDTECGQSSLVMYLPLSPESANDPKFRDIINDNIDKLALHQWELIRLYKTDYYIELRPEATRRNKTPETFFIEAIASIRQNM